MALLDSGVWRAKANHWRHNVLGVELDGRATVNRVHLDLASASDLARALEVVDLISRGVEGVRLKSSICQGYGDG